MAVVLALPLCHSIVSSVRSTKTMSASSVASCIPVSIASSSIVTCPQSRRVPLSLSASSSFDVMGGKLKSMFSWLAKSLRARMFMLTVLVLAVALKIVRGRLDVSNSKKIKTSTPKTVTWDTTSNASEDATKPGNVLNTTAQFSPQNSSPSGEAPDHRTVHNVNFGLRHRSSLLKNADVVAVGSSNDIRTPLINESKGEVSGFTKQRLNANLNVDAPASWEVVDDDLGSDDEDGALFF